MISIVQLVVILIVIGVLLWAINTIFPLDPKIRTIINVVVMVAVCLWLLQVFGLFHGFPGRLG